MTIFNRTMLAEDFVESKLKFPCIVQPKIDGVRGLYPDERGMLARSLKYHGNKFTRAFFSNVEFAGFDGELAAEHECNPDLCRITTSATSSHDGEPWLLWHVFDYIMSNTVSLPYIERLAALENRVKEIQESHPNLGVHLKAIPYKVVNNLEELYAYEDWALSQGYEGVCLRDPLGPYKNGRSTPTKGELLRIKRFQVDDALCVGIEEAMYNGNEAFTDERGYTKRSSHQENMIPKGMVGAIVCRKLEETDLTKTFKIGPGRMTEKERVYYFENQHLIVNQVVKYKHFPKGVKDKPRLPTFEVIRSPEDVL